MRAHPRFHDDHRVAIRRFYQLEEANDVGVIKRPKRLCFEDEAFGCFRIGLVRHL